MSDAPAKKRPWFQLHLSTCVVLMVVAGVLVWQNVIISRISCGRGPDFSGTSTGNGFPLICYESGHELSRLSNTEQWIDKSFHRWRVGPLVLNTLVGLAILVASACACEYLIRRRERNRRAMEPVHD